MARIFATCDIGAEALDLVRQAGHQLEVWPSLEPPSRDVLVSKVRSGIEGLITTLRDPVDRGVLEAGRGTLRVVAQDAVGYDNVDVGAATEFGIVLTHTADVLTEATAEFAFFILGAVTRKLAPSEALVREGRWSYWHPHQPFLGDEATGATVAVIGCGRIGRSFALKCTGLDMDLLLVEPVISPEWIEGCRRVQAARVALGCRQATTRQVTLAEALPLADYVSLHVPLVASGPGCTRHLIGEQALRSMKPTAYLINTSRGPVVDEATLARELRAGTIGGAALDVFEKEPLRLDSPLLAEDLRDRVRVFHHFASGTRRTRLSIDPAVGMAGRTVAGLLDALQEAPRHRYAVNPPRSR